MARRGSTVQSVSVPAPTGGINTIDSLMALPPTDCAYAWNLIASEFGLRARSGYREHCTTLDGEVRSMVPFVGSRTDGATSKLFATTSTGIWDVTVSSASPAQLVVFPLSTGEAGYGSSCVVTTPGGRYLVYCDEVNGTYLWSEVGAAWTKVRYGATVAWTPSTAYLVGDLVTNGVNAYECISAGTSAGAGGPTGQGIAIVDGGAQWDFSEGPWTATQAYKAGNVVSNGAAPVRLYVCTGPGTSAGAGGPSGTGTAIADNTVTWDYLADYSAPIGTSLFDQHLGYSADPANHAFPVVWKGRLWLVERDTTRAWYLPVSSIAGTAESFDFGVRFRAGGPLVGLYNWSYDAGNGLDSLLVGISTTGDLVMYQGTDPSSTTTFGLKGTWSVGPLPHGRNVATDYGGDMLVLSTQGVVPLSKLVVGQPVVGGDRSVYATGKIGNLFAQAASLGRTLSGWGLVIHPADNALLVLVPSAAGAPTTQLAMSFATRGWTQYRDLPMVSACAFDGTLYFGTLDGRVCVNSGYVDAVLLATPTESQPVAWSLLTGFSMLGTPKQKRLLGIRANIMSQSAGAVVQATGKTRLDTTEPAPPSSGTLPKTGSVWDTAVWDSSKWAGDFSSTQPLVGGGVCGRELAVAVRGLSVTRTILTGIDVQYDVGGDL